MKGQEVHWDDQYTPGTIDTDLAVLPVPQAGLLVELALGSDRHYDGRHCPTDWAEIKTIGVSGTVNTTICHIRRKQG